MSPDISCILLGAFQPRPNRIPKHSLRHNPTFNILVHSHNQFMFGAFCPPNAPKSWLHPHEISLRPVFPVHSVHIWVRHSDIHIQSTSGTPASWCSPKHCFCAQKKKNQKTKKSKVCGSSIAPKSVISPIPTYQLPRTRIPTSSYLILSDVCHLRGNLRGRQIEPTNLGTAELPLVKSLARSRVPS